MRGSTSVRRFVWSGVAACALACLSPAKAAQTVASANLCADQLVLELGDVRQVLGLSPMSRDPHLSFHASLSSRFPALKGSAEELVALSPSLVLLGRFDSAYTREVLRQRGLQFLLIDTWTTFDDMEKGVRAVASAMGQASRGEELLQDVARSLARLDALRPQLAPRTSALILLRRGFVLHDGLVAEILKRAGFRNAAADVGAGAGGFASLENIVHKRPDFIVTADARQVPEDQGEALLLHPALGRLYPLDKRIVAPDRLSTCAGPSTPALIDALRQEIEAKVVKRQGH